MSVDLKETLKRLMTASMQANIAAAIQQSELNKFLERIEITEKTEDGPSRPE